MSLHYTICSTVDISLHRGKFMDKTLNTIKEIILSYLKPYKVSVYLYGSRAKNNFRPHSDVDIAILAEKPLPNGLIPALREALEESTITLNVEIVDLAHSDETFRKKVLKEGVLWKDSKSEE